MAVPVWTPPPTFFIGHVETDTELNPVFNGNMSWLHWAKYVRLSKTATQSITNSTATALTWGQEDRDDWALHSLVTNTSRITMIDQVAGIWTLSAVVEFAANATGLRTIELRKNGTAFATKTKVAPASGVCSIDIESSVPVVSTDYLEVWVTQTSGGALNVDSGTSFTWAEAIWQGALS